MSHVGLGGYWVHWVMCDMVGAMGHAGTWGTFVRTHGGYGGCHMIWRILGTWGLSSKSPRSYEGHGDYCGHVLYCVGVPQVPGGTLMIWGTLGTW